MIQAYSVMMTSLLFTDNKEVWFYADRQHPKQDMFIHIMLIDPFRFMFVFRNIFKPQGGSYFMNFQIQGDECELISVYREEAYKYPLVPYTNHDALIVEAGFQKKFPMAKLKEFGAKISARIKGHTRVPQVQPNIRPPPQ